MKRILIVDDNPDILDALDLLLSLQDYQVLQASTVKEAVLACSRQQVDLMIQDMNFSEGTTLGEEGKKLFYDIRQNNPDLPVILITAWGSIETAIELVKAGAKDYLPKPWNDTKLLEIIASHVNLSGKQNSGKPNRGDQQSRSSKMSIIYQSLEMASLIDMAGKVAQSDISALITGPNGSGKEKLADYIHQNSSRSNRPFIKVNMGAIPHELMEAELFGSQKGAFTGSDSERIGRFEAADGGTLFLDEIGNMSLAGQMKLLRVLQSGEFERLGSSVTIKVDVRVISATNTELSVAIRQGQFREDLYYRLNMVELKLLALCKRKADILPLARHFIGFDHTLSKDAEQFLVNHHWPGNVRELENACKRAMIFSSNGIINSTDLSNMDQQHKFCEKTHLQQVLEKHQWNISHAASELGLSRQTLYRRIEKYRLRPNEL
ncbi:MAG: sigma-54-dependent Fis family transcriptional regulator [Alteromonadaceae bacterium]|nr:sigma-54-dependent Fis family transcriptional regulator [Alteromonadaceae bacterium]